MTLRWLVATIHLLALVIGAGAICVRAWSLRTAADPGRLPTVFLADTFWGIAAMLWIGTGVWRAFGGLEKGSEYYLGSTAFWIKMTLLLAILALEVRPMVTLIRWRRAAAHSAVIDLAPSAALARTSMLQLALVCGMVAAAAAMARGLLP
jgi:putative membrane protein